MNFQLFAVQSYYKTLSFITPKIAANKAFMLFQKVRIKASRKREEDFFIQAKKETIPSKLFDYQVYEMGDPQGKPVMLIHGWDSNIGSLSNFAFDLAKEGYRVIALNLPAHGESNQDHTNMFECKNCVKQVLAHYNFKEPISLISHSFGSGVAAYALSEVDVKVDRIVFLTVANRIEDIFMEFKEMISLGEKSYQMMIQKANGLLGEDLYNLNTENKLKLANFEKALIVHDKYDKVLPYSNAEAIAQAVDNVTVLPFEKIGHYRMLWNEDVLKATMDYLAD